MTDDTRIPTPLVIVTFKNGDTVTEYTRFRGTPDTFYELLHLALFAASLQDVDEAVIRVLRPVYE